MGLVADKIAKKFISPRRSKDRGLAVWLEWRKIALELGFGEDGFPLDKSAMPFPCHKLYVLGHNFVSYIAGDIYPMREAKGFVRTYDNAEEDYRPSGPPMSPLTTSFFCMWAMFDIRFGSSRDTMGTCMLRVATEYDCPSWLTDVVERMQQSRMGFYVHCGSEGKVALLREVGTLKILSCEVASGYVGREGDIWFVRVLPPLHHLCRHHVVFNTPYVIRDFSELDFFEYLKRELARMTATRVPRRMDDAYFHLMKYGPDPNHWNEYVFLAYSNYQHEAVFLFGIPDIPQSLPHGRLARS